MYNISISLDKTQYKEKPNNDDAKKLSLQIGRSPVCITAANDIYRFVEAVGKEGRTWSPATFSDGQRKINAFEQQQLFVLDFDGGITWQECFDRAEKYNLPILFAYDTFSSVSHDRFRVVFLNDTAISDKRVAKTMTMALRVIFPESDSSCDDVSHFYYGGKELIYFDKNIPEINIESLIMNMGLYPDVVNVAQMQTMLGIGKNTAYDLLNNKIIESVRIGKVHKIPKKNIIKYMKGHNNFTK